MGVGASTHDTPAGRVAALEVETARLRAALASARARWVRAALVHRGGTLPAPLPRAATGERWTAHQVRTGRQRLCAATPHAASYTCRERHVLHRALGVGKAGQTSGDAVYTCGYCGTQGGKAEEWYRCAPCDLMFICAGCARLQPARVLPKVPLYTRSRLVVFYRPGADLEAGFVRRFARAHSARLITPDLRPRHPGGHPRATAYFSKTSNCAVYRDRRLVTDEGVAAMLDGGADIGNSQWDRPLVTGLYITKRKLVVLLVDGMQGTEADRARAADARERMEEAAAALRDAHDTEHAFAVEGDAERARWLRCRVAAAGGRSLGKKCPTPGLLVVQYSDARGHTGTFWKCPAQAKRRTVTVDQILGFVADVSAGGVTARCLTEPYFDYDLGLMKRTRAASPGAAGGEGDNVFRCRICNVTYSTFAEIHHHELSDEHIEKAALAAEAKRVALGRAAWSGWQARAGALVTSWTSKPDDNAPPPSDAKPVSTWTVTLPRFSGLAFPSAGSLVPFGADAASWRPPAPATDGGVPPVPQPAPAVAPTDTPPAPADPATATVPRARRWAPFALAAALLVLVLLVLRRRVAGLLRRAIALR